MSFGLRYRSEILSIEKVPYRIEISQEGYTGSVTDVIMSGSPVTIEWGETDKIEPVQSSCATIELLSESDRQFVDLYTVEPGTIRLDIYRNNVIYWSGMLDPELYSEPYAYDDTYVVQFTFSDFAILDRLSWEDKGISSIQLIVDNCLTSTGINYNELKKHISTKANSYETSPIDLSQLNINGENFFDEDGEAKTMREVLDEVLRPFALRMIQKGGNIYIYDLNAIHTDMATEQVEWYDVDSNLDASEIYNNVQVTFSPYADAALIDGRLEHDEVLKGKEGQLYKVNNDWQNTADGFRIVNGDDADQPLTLSNNAKFFRIDSEYSGNDEAGVAFAYKGTTASGYNNFVLGGGFPRVFDPNSGAILTKPIITTKKAFIGYVPNATDYQLRICLDLLFDVRYNPFEGPDVQNEKGNYERLTDWCNFGYVPAMLYLKDANGNILYHFVNSGVMNSNSYQHGSLCYWASGAGSWGNMFLCYYDKENRKSASGFGGWTTNRQIIGYYRDELPKKWSVMQDGEYIPLPPAGGYLELQIGSGIHQFDYGKEVKDIYSIARWLLYRNPKVELVKKNGTRFEQEDIEDTAWLNKAAKEDLSVDTIIGTLDGKHLCPTARGSILHADHSAYTTFCRAGVTDRLERLLIGTVYSQYAKRNDSLSGTVHLLPSMKVMTDASTQGKFIVLEEVQHLVDDTSEIKMTRFEADNYSGIEYK